ncbi:MAG: hypothetical protein N2506_06940, partial [Dehalococcoidales bacterium]|nr:hypothetical protein [Dehalococcoidales bacterium]
GLAAIMAKKWPEDYRYLKEALPSWLLFYNLAGYDYYPEKRIEYQRKDVLGITRQLGVEAKKAIGEISANDVLKTVQQPSGEPYWKLRYRGGCEDIFFLTIYSKLENQIRAMYRLVEEDGYPVSDMGVYVQPVVQGTSVHCEFNLFYDPANPAEVERVRRLSAAAVRTLLDHGAFFSRPYGESAAMIMNRNAAGVLALSRIKKVLDPNNILNTGKLCF